MSNTWPPPPPPPPRPSPALQPPPPTAPPDRRRFVAGAAIGVLIALLVAVVAAIALRNDDDTGALADSAISSTTRAPSGATSTTSPGAGSGTLDAAIDEAIAFIEKTRGRSFKSRPPVNALGDTAFVARFNQLLDEDYAKHRADYDSATIIYQALGILRTDVTYVDAQREFGASGVLGFYDPESNELTLRAGKVTPFAKITLIHELTHAFDDQWFELDRPQYDDAKDEVAFGLSAVAEGNARRVENAYRATMSSSDQRAADNEELGYSANFSMDKFTVPFLQLEIAPYTYGEPFVEELLDSGGESAVDEALRSPPTTSEQVIDFRKYKAREARREVAAPPADGTVVEDGVAGQIAIQSILEGSISRSSARQAASGWGGDWFVAWRDGNVPCVRLRAVMDTTSDFSELRSAFESWVRGRGGASVSVSGSELTLTACAR